MTKLQEALRLSEEAFMKIADLRNLGKIQPEVIAFETLYTIREALQKQAEQEKQEPVAIDWEPLQNFWRNNSSVDWEELEFAVKCAVAAPVRTKDLTPHEITALIREGAADGGWQGFAQRVIAKFKEKNK